MGRFLLLSVLALVTALGPACGDDDDSTPADGGDGTDGGGAPTTIDEVPVEEEISVSCVEGEVSAVQDDRGMWHIYAETLEDAFCAQGYLMARDRMGQMEIIRRSVTGRVAELAASISPGTVDADIAARWEGNVRNAEKILAEITAEEQGLLEAYSAGINAYIALLRDDVVGLPRGVQGILQVDVIDDWTTLDTLAIARFMTAMLSFDADEDLRMTEALAAWQEAFEGGGPRSPLEGAFHDVFPYEPPREVFSRDGFPNVGEDTGTRAFLPPSLSDPAPAERMRLPSREQLAAARRFTQRIEARYEQLFGDESRGSNSWVVHGDLTASGNPILANDPHLQLSSPPLFWMVHINTERAGGDVDVQGLALVGTPAVLLGYNRHVAWGLTTHGFDVTDVYLETITPGTGGEPDTVEFDGAQVPIETITETIEVDVGEPVEVTFEVVPHHGLIIPDTRTDTSAISVKWTGNEPTHELRAFLMMARAQTVEDIETAYDEFGVGGQNLVAVTRDGHIFWTTDVRLPVRDPRAMTYDPATQTGYAPSFVLPGTGEYEWTGFLEDRYMPHALDPASGFIATANNDGVGVTADGNPFNDPHYIGWGFSDGHRVARITERLEEMAAGGEITPEDMSELQADAQSPMGRLATAALVAELDRAIEEAASPGTHADLETLVADAGTDTMARIESMRDRLAAWESFDTPAAVEGSPSDQEIADSAATTIFNAGFSRLVRLLVDDEAAVVGSRGRASRTILTALNAPETMASYDADLEDTVLWDDISTDGVTETRGQQVLTAFVDALGFLEAELGSDMDEWRWGKLHTLRLESVVPTISGANVVDIPPEDSEEYPDGFPRHGDNFVVDASHYGVTDTDDFSYGSGPVQRLVVEMTPDGPRIWNALPGGESIDPDSPHHADEMERWRRNEAPPVAMEEPDVAASAERRWVFAAP